MTQLIIPNTNSHPSTPITASFTAAKQKCLSCKGQQISYIFRFFTLNFSLFFIDFTEIIRLLHIINGRVTQNAELITAILNTRNEHNIQDNPKAADIIIDIPAKTYIELMELDKKLSDKNIREFMVIFTSFIITLINA